MLKGLMIGFSRSEMSMLMGVGPSTLFLKHLEVKLTLQPDSFMTREQGLDLGADQV